jgi:hypothetical protein
MAPAVVHRTGKPVALTHFNALLTPLAGAVRAPAAAPTPAPTPAPTVPPTAFPTGPAASAIAAVLINPMAIHDNNINFFISILPKNSLFY